MKTNRSLDIEMNQILKEDINNFVFSFELSEFLNGSKILVTGATGLIGSTLVRCLLALNKGIQITCPIRNLKKAKAIYGDDVQSIRFIECDLVEYLNSLTEKDDFKYIVHCASPTVGRYMTEHPVETYMLAIDSTRAILEYARKKQTDIVYVSSLEYYGQNFDDTLITEDMQGYVNNTDPRSSYPLGKRAAEYLCVAYAKQFDVNAKVARLTQTFGAGVSVDDNRVFAQFARSVIEGTNIVMHTKGESAKPYCYTTDCVSAILYILIQGEKGEAYNVANEETYISIKDMADFLCAHFNPQLKVVVEEHPEMGYAPVTKLNLSTEKLKSLGWSPRYGLYDMFDRLIKSFK